MGMWVRGRVSIGIDVDLDLHNSIVNVSNLNQMINCHQTFVLSWYQYQFEFSRNDVIFVLIT